MQVVLQVAGLEWRWATMRRDDLSHFAFRLSVILILLLPNPFV